MKKTILAIGLAASVIASPAAAATAPDQLVPVRTSAAAGPAPRNGAPLRSW